MAVNIRGQHFLKLLDFSAKEIEYLIDLSVDFKNMKRAGVPHRYLEGKNIVLLFAKTSLCIRGWRYGPRHGRNLSCSRFFSDGQEGVY